MWYASKKGQTVAGVIGLEKLHTKQKSMKNAHGLNNQAVFECFASENLFVRLGNTPHSKKSRKNKSACVAT